MTETRVDSDEHIAMIVGPTIREIYGDTAELGHYKLAIAVYKMATKAALDAGVASQRVGSREFLKRWAFDHNCNWPGDDPSERVFDGKDVVSIVGQLLASQRAGEAAPTVMKVNHGESPKSVNELPGKTRKKDIHLDLDEYQ